jgi:hypothetical protein
VEILTKEHMGTSSIAERFFGDPDVKRAKEIIKTPGFKVSIYRWNDHFNFIKALQEYTKLHSS